MTTYPSAPMPEATLATVDTVAGDVTNDRDWARFRSACEQAAWLSADLFTVDPNVVRSILAGRVAPRRVSAFWMKATSSSGFLDNSGQWTTNTDLAGGNSGKPLRLRKLRVAA